jgi:hypothetical protein
MYSHPVYLSFEEFERAELRSLDGELSAEMVESLFDDELPGKRKSAGGWSWTDDEE